MPSLGRWLTPDPLGLSAGLNLYAFVCNDPLVKVDLYGLIAAWSSPTFGTMSFLQNTPEKDQFARGALHGAGSFVMNTASLIGRAGYYANFQECQQYGYTPQLMRQNMQRFHQWGNDYMQQILPADESSSSYRMGHFLGEHGVDLTAGAGLAKAGYHIVKGGAQFIGRRLATRSLLKTAANDALLPTISKELKMTVNNIRSVESEYSVMQQLGKASRNRLQPNSLATGAHTVFRRDPITGVISHYETFTPQFNIMDPKRWASVKRFDGVGMGDGHFNKITREFIGCPHVHDLSVAGGIRQPFNWELPTSYAR